MKLEVLMQAPSLTLVAVQVTKDFFSGTSQYVGNFANLSIGCFVLKTKQNKNIAYYHVMQCLLLGWTNVVQNCLTDTTC